MNAAAGRCDMEELIAALNAMQDKLLTGVEAANV